MKLRLLQTVTVALALLVTLGPARAAPDAVAAAQTARLHALFDRFWQESAERFPEWATWRGDHRYDDRLEDVSEAAEQADDAWGDALLDEAKSIRRDALAPADRVSLDLFVYKGEQHQAMRKYTGWRHMAFGSTWGFQGLLPGLLRAMNVRDEARAEQALARMAAYPKRVQQEIDNAGRAAALGWIKPRPVLERSLGQIDAQLAAPAGEGAFMESLSGLADAALRKRLLDAVERDVLPAQRKLRAYIADELLPRAPEAGGLSRYPQGAEVYAALVREHTTTELTPEQVHQLGLRELERIRRGYDEVRLALKVEGGLPELLTFLDQPQYHFDSAEALLDSYRAVAKRIDPELPRLFAELPRAPYGIRAMPEFMGPGAADNYSSPAPDGSEPGWFNANTLSWRSKTTWSQPTLVAHETVPGHHLQNARDLELRGLPEFRRHGSYTAFGEGWALYAETLGNEIGLYERPEDRFGHLQMQAFRAARLVVDTGLHAMGWSRQRAIDFMREATGQDPEFIESEVDRYLSNPGQALAYMVGQLKIIELRERARAALGPRFDLRRFHNALLDQGPLPLSVLDDSIAEWTAAELRSAREAR